MFLVRATGIPWVLEVQMEWFEILVLVHLASTWFMVGLIWFVQVVHYPLFAEVGRDSFAEYEKRHTIQTSWVVGPPMLAEISSAAFLVFADSSLLDSTAFVASLVLLGVIWASTALFQMPMHGRLSHGFEASVHRRLVGSNWIRAFAWSLRGVLVLLVFWAL